MNNQMPYMNIPNYNQGNYPSNSIDMQLERLNDEELKGEELKEELMRANVITNVAKEIISNGNLMLQATKLQVETLGRSQTNMPKMLEG